jgi:hypothetical protein
MGPHRLPDAVARPDGAVGETDLATDGAPALRATPPFDLREDAITFGYGETGQARGDRRKRLPAIVGRDQKIGECDDIRAYDASLW